MLGPTYGSPIKKVFILPATEDVKANFRCMAFIIKDKVSAGSEIIEASALDQLNKTADQNQTSHKR